MIISVITIIKIKIILIYEKIKMNHLNAKYIKKNLQKFRNSKI